MVRRTELVTRTIKMYPDDWKKFDNLRDELFQFLHSRSRDAQTIRRLIYEFENQQLHTWRNKHQ